MLSLKSLIKPTTLLMIVGLNSINAYSDAIDISLSGDAAQFYYMPEASADVESDDGGLGFGFLYNDEGDFMLSAKLLVPSANSSGLQLSPGVKVNYIDVDGVGGNFNVSLALGGQASGRLTTALPLRAYAEIFYAPAITSFDKLESVLETGVGLAFQVSSNAQVYLGFRKISVELKDVKKDYEIDDSFHLGTKFSF